MKERRKPPPRGSPYERDRAGGDRALAKHAHSSTDSRRGATALIPFSPIDHAAAAYSQAASHFFGEFARPISRYQKEKPTVNKARRVHSPDAFNNTKGNRQLWLDRK